eukprot:4436958-Pleurochrysis_carterae.AAC.1
MAPCAHVRVRVRACVHACMRAQGRPRVRACERERGQLCVRSRVAAPVRVERHETGRTRSDDSGSLKRVPGLQKHLRAHTQDTPHRHIGKSACATRARKSPLHRNHGCRMPLTPPETHTDTDGRSDDGSFNSDRSLFLLCPPSQTLARTLQIQPPTTPTSDLLIKVTMSSRMRIGASQTPRCSEESIDMRSWHEDVRRPRQR